MDPAPNGNTLIAGRRPNLVFARVGDRTLHPSWLAGDAERNWDLQLSFYGDDASVARDGDLPLSVDRGTKWDSIFRYLRAHPEVFERYQYLAFPDDDLAFGPGRLNRFFETCGEFDLSLAQPALTAQSYYSHPITLRCPAFRLRYTNFIEGMAPCFKAAYLKTMLPELDGWYSGWGIARVWALLMPDPVRRAAIVDEAPMTHTRPLSSGTIYKDLAQLDVNPHEELARVRASYDSVPTMMATYGGRLRSGRLCGGTSACLINGLCLLTATPRLKVRRFAFLSGGRMLMRAFTQAGYEPVQSHRRPLYSPLARTVRPMTGVNARVRGEDQSDSN